jgi:hypothetical protein
MILEKGDTIDDLNVPQQKPDSDLEHWSINWPASWW